MKALVYQGPEKKEWIEKPIPTIQEPTDALVRIVKTTICGSDLHILKGDVPTAPIGLTLGHEGVGIVESVGSAVKNFAVGDKVVIACVTHCGQCDSCQKGLFSHCKNGGWILGHTIDGTQAEYVRIPYGDTSLFKVPENVDDDALVMMSCAMPTAFEVGVTRGEVKPGSRVGIVGAGPVGLASVITAKLYSPAQIIVIDLDENRLELAKKFGATHVVNSSDGKAVEKMIALTDGRGVDVAIEAVGVPATFEICQHIVGIGGNIANIGIHGKPVNFDLDKLWGKNITLRSGIVNTSSTAMLIDSVKSGRLHPEELITHRFELNNIMEAYDVFGNATREKALKVLISKN